MGITWSADMSWLGGGEAGQVVVTQVSTGIHSVLTQCSPSGQYGVDRP